MAEEKKDAREPYRPGALLRDVATGVIMGVANIIPGVSGGTMAVVTGVYDKVIRVFTIDRKFIKREWRFVAVVVLSMLAGIFAFSNVIKFLLLNYPVATNAFFIGVVIGTCPFIFRRTAGPGHRVARVLPALATLALMVAMTLLDAKLNPETTASYMAHTFANCAILGSTMILTSACMIIPGVSGSFVALALGVYPSLIGALSSFDIVLLLPMLLGTLIGLIGGSRLIKFLLSRFKIQTYSAIFGLLLGSVFTLAYPLAPDIALNGELLVSALTLLAGGAVALIFAKTDKSA